MSEKINAILVDDERNSLLTLEKLLQKYCPEVNVIGKAQNVEEGIKVINDKKPDLVFLDIAMPDGDGFEVLEKVSHKLFEVIFTTAYDQYALKAFEFSALHYLLKPINFKELQEAVARFEKVKSEEDFDDKIKLLKENLARQQNKIILPSMEGLNIIELDDIVRCESDNNYTIFHLTSGKRLVVSKTLNNFEKLLADKDFYRIHSKHLVNMKYIKKYVKGRGGYVVFEDGSHADVSAGRMKEFLTHLKMYAKSL
jgi:two-component system LytT family response regulator